MLIKYNTEATCGKIYLTDIHFYQQLSHPIVHVNLFCKINYWARTRRHLFVTATAGFFRLCCVKPLNDIASDITSDKRLFFNFRSILFTFIHRKHTLNVHYFLTYEELEFHVREANKSAKSQMKFHSHMRTNKENFSVIKKIQRFFVLPLNTVILIYYLWKEYKRALGP